MRTQHRSPTIPLFRQKPLYAALAFALAPAAAQAIVLDVNSTSDANSWDSITSTGTLRVAINFLNGSCSPGDTIAFDAAFTSASPFVTAPATDLPAVQCAGTVIDGNGSHTDAASRVVIDGRNGLDYGIATSTAGYGGAITVRGLAVRNIANGAALDGDIAASQNIITASSIGIRSTQTISQNTVSGNGIGIVPTFSNSQVNSNVVFGNSTGISASSFFGTISGNTVGLDLSGAIDANVTGIELDFSGATVSGNTVSGNGIGIIVDGGGNLISGNKIGTDANGLIVKANKIGIAVEFAYGGVSISGNSIVATSTAVTVEGSGSVNISSNVINADVGRNGVLGGGEGVVAACSFDVVLNGNFIASSGHTGIDFGGVEGSVSGEITNNAIGVVGSVTDGISLHDATCSSGPAAKALSTKLTKAGTTPTEFLGIYNNTITNASQNGIVLNQAYHNDISSENIVTHSRLYGIEILAGTGNSILQNFIYGNGVGLGPGAKNLDLNFHATTFPPSLPNDPGDADTDPVPNDGQNYPAIDSVSYDPFFDQTTIAFTLDTQPGNYRVDFYENNPPTNVPGGVPLSFANTFLPVTATGGTPGSYTVAGRHSSISLTATLTDTTGNGIETSEYSPVNNSTLVPALTASPTTIDFGDVGINTSSAARTITLASTGTDTDTIETVRVSDGTCYGGSLCYGGEFVCSTTCQEGGQYAPGTNCTITATFQPFFTGPTSMVLRVCDHSVGTQFNFARHDITLIGNGFVPSPAVFDAVNFDFGPIGLFKSRPPHTFTLTNPTSSAVTLGSPSTSSADFILGNNTCGGTLNVGASCTMDVTFSPLSVGTINGTLSLPTSGGLVGASTKLFTYGGGAVASVALTGSGTQQGQITLPSLVDFGTFITGTESFTQDVTLTNAGNQVVNFSSVSVTGPFTIANNCGASLAAGASCTITITFTGTDVGDYTGSLVVTDDAPGGSGTVMLTASIATSPEPKLLVTPPTLGFGSRMFGTSTASQTITIKNIGSGDAAITSLTIGSDFVINANTCPATLVPSATCTANVSFHPLGFGLRQEKFEVHSNAVNDPQGSQLTGTGCRPFGVTTGAASCSP